MKSQSISGPHWLATCEEVGAAATLFRVVQEAVCPDKDPVGAEVTEMLGSEDSVNWCIFQL